MHFSIDFVLYFVQIKGDSTRKRGVLKWMISPEKCRKSFLQPVMS